MAYKVLGWAVWKGAKFYLRRRLPYVPSRRLLAGGFVAVVVVAMAARGAASSDS